METLREKVLARLVKNGNNEVDANNAVNAYFDYVVKTYKDCTPKKMAEVIWVLYCNN